MGIRSEFPQHAAQRLCVESRQAGAPDRCARLIVELGENGQRDLVNANDALCVAGRVPLPRVVLVAARVTAGQEPPLFAGEVADLILS
jgi:hypothetical protein